MDNATIIMEPSGPHYGSYFVIETILHDEKSDFQRIMVFESGTLGRVLMLDNIFNVSTRMEAYYHEPMAHIPLAMLNAPKRVLVIGGGDFGIARELLRHDSLEEVVMCELDPKVLEVSRRFFPEWAACEADPRFTLEVGDGCAYVEGSPDASFDAIIIDSTDPILHAPMLISKGFYDDVHRALTDEGVVMQIIADTILYPEAWETVIPRVDEVFAEVHPLFVPIPFYATGPWGLMLAGKQPGVVDPARCSSEYLNPLKPLRTLTPAGIAGWFSLPPEHQGLFDDIRTKRND